MKSSRNRQVTPIQKVNSLKSPSHNTLHERFIEKGAFQYQETKEAIRAKLEEETNDGIDFLIISLLCPNTRTKIMTPVRSQNCDHIQCIDLNNYLELNKIKPVWKCPICNNDAHYDSLIFDLYVGEIILNADENVTEVKLMADGSWNVEKIVDEEQMNQMDGETQSMAAQIDAPVEEEKMNMIDQADREIQHITTHTSPEEEKRAETAARETSQSRKYDNISDDDFNFD